MSSVKIMGGPMKQPQSQAVMLIFRVRAKSLYCQMKEEKLLALAKAK